MRALSLANCPVYIYIIERKNNAYFLFGVFIINYVKIEICWKWPNTEGIIKAWSNFNAKLLKFCLFTQGVQLKNHKFWSVNSPSGADSSLAPKLVQTLSRILNNVSEISSRIFSIANSLQTKFCSFMQMPESKQFSRQHKIMCILQ